MSTFELYLFKDPPVAADLDAVMDALLGTGVIEPSPGEDDRVWYRNPHTGVAFPIVFSLEAAESLSSRVPQVSAGGEEGGFERSGDAGEAPPDSEEAEEAEEADEDEDGDEEEKIAGGAPEPEVPAVALTIPTLCPSFVAREAIALAAAIARAGGLRLEHPEAAEGSTPEGLGDPLPPAGAAGSNDPSGALSPEALFRNWDRARRHFARLILEAGGGIELPLGQGARSTVRLTSWSPAKTEGWWRYGLGRAELEAALEREGVRVPVLQTAFHGGAMKSLCDWETWGPAVIPRTDLVLVRRRRLRKGLLKTKEVVEEGIADGTRVWSLLAPLVEYRSEPAELLVLRQAAPFPAHVAAGLDALPLESLESARRAPLIGVVDFDLAEVGPAKP